LGGEHSLTFETVRAYVEAQGGSEGTLQSAPLVVIYLDAHTDLYPAYQDNPLSHA